MNQCHTFPKCSNEVTQAVPDISTKTVDEDKGIIAYNYTKDCVVHHMTKFPFMPGKLGLHDDIGPPL